MTNNNITYLCSLISRYFAIMLLLSRAHARTRTRARVWVAATSAANAGIAGIAGDTDFSRVSNTANQRFRNNGNREYCSFPMFIK